MYLNLDQIQYTFSNQMMESDEPLSLPSSSSQIYEETSTKLNILIITF